MKKIITIIALVLTVAFSVLAVSCGARNEQVDVTTKTITVGYTDYAPMNYEEDGVLKGFDTELAIMTFNALGYEVRFKLIDWANKYVELEAGNIDCIWNGFTANSEDDGIPRSEKVDFTAYYLENNQCVIRNKNTAEITEISQFNGKSVAFENGSAGEGYVDSLEGVSINKKGFAAQLNAVMNVNNGTAQYAVVDRTLAESYVGKNDYANLVINEGIEIPVEYYAVGFKKGSELTQKVNVMFNAFEETGVMLELATKYNLVTRLVEIDL